MILIKKIRIIALISILCLLIVYLLWNNMSLKGNWPDDSDTVSIEWYDYKGIYHNQTLTEEERSGETQKVNKNQKKQEETILSDSSGNSAPYVIKELEPEISGIVISCEGAGNKVVEASVLEAVQVLFGVSPNHIKVLKMQVAK